MSKGFERKSRTDIVDDMESRAQNLFGQSVNLAENSPLGILIQLFSWPLFLLWSALEKIYNAYYINTATGQDLDNLAKNIGISRILAAKATGEIEFSGDEGTIIPEEFLVETDSDPAIQFETTEEVTIDSDGETTAEIIAVEAGSSGIVSSDTITKIVNPISGLDSVNNPDATDGGRDEETDAEFRERYKDSLDRPGGSTVNSIRANVLEETEATACIVLENTSLEEDDNGLPGKSFETIALGGTDDNIAEAIFDKKPAGMESFGEISITLEDDAGLEKIVDFSRAKSVDIYIDVELDEKSNYPSDGDDQVIDEIVDYIGGNDTEGDSVQGLSIGENVIYTKIINLIYNVDGIEDVTTLEIGTDESDLGTDNITIDNRKVARTEPDNIEVTSS